VYSGPCTLLAVVYHTVGAVLGTSIYTCVSSDFRTRTLRQALDQTLRQALHTNGVAG